MAEKKVNYGVQGIEDLVSDLNNSKDQNGTEQPGAIAIPSRKATGRPLNGIIEEALIKYFEIYEKNNGEIIVPEIYRTSATHP